MRIYEVEEDLPPADVLVWGYCQIGGILTQNYIHLMVKWNPRYGWMDENGNDRVVIRWCDLSFPSLAKKEEQVLAANEE